jgi:Transmembrane domain of unknown function (DUF3566)
MSDESSKQSLGERINSAIAAASVEMRANANPESKSHAAEATAANGRSPRRARLRLTRVDPWSVMKTSFLLAVAFGIVAVVAVAVVWTVLGIAGVWESINSTVSGVMGGSGDDFEVSNYLGTTRVLGFTMLISVINTVLIPAIATLTAFLYNMAAALLGGIEVTLAEDER